MPVMCRHEREIGFCEQCIRESKNPRKHLYDALETIEKSLSAARQRELELLAVIEELREAAEAKLRELEMQEPARFFAKEHEPAAYIRQRADGTPELVWNDKCKFLYYSTAAKNADIPLYFETAPKQEEKCNTTIAPPC